VADDILVIEDEPAMVRVLQVGLEARGYRVRIATDGHSALDAVQYEEPAVVLLDLGLPDMDGLVVCEQLHRYSRCSVIVLTADGADDRKVLALDRGAVDYVTKPFSVEELMARIRVALRHRRAVASIADDDVLVVGDVRVDLGAHEAFDRGQPVALTPKEFKLLALFARNRGKVLTHRMIIDHVWDHDASVRTETLRVLVNQLRRKLRDESPSARLLTEPGVGYRLVG
jgi:two-component system KDP operon response regulator KdpE